MAWENPKTNWQGADVPSADDFNRIEGNIQHLQDTKETPAGAQAKAEAAAATVQSNLNTHTNDSTAHITSSERAAWNAKLDSSAYTAADVLEKIKTVDGAGSGLDADLVQGGAGFSMTNKPYAYGSYTGNGAASRLINLGFTPSAVLLIGPYGITGTAYTGRAVSGGFFTASLPLYGGSSKIAASVATNGFNIYFDDDYGLRTNENDVEYRYIAFK